MTCSRHGYTMKQVRKTWVDSHVTRANPCRVHVHPARPNDTRHTRNWQPGGRCAGKVVMRTVPQLVAQECVETSTCFSVSMKTTSQQQKCRCGDVGL